MRMIPQSPDDIAKNPKPKPQQPAIAGVPGIKPGITQPVLQPLKPNTTPGAPMFNAPAPPPAAAPTLKMAPPLPAMQTGGGLPASVARPVSDAIPTLTANNLTGYNPGARPAGFTDLRPTTITAPQLGGTVGGPGLRGDVSAPQAGPRIGAQDPSQTLAALQEALRTANDPDSRQLHEMSMDQLTGLSSAPNRAQLAAQALELQRERTQPQWEKDLRQVGALNAALGRTGSGMLTSDLMDVTAQRERDLGLFGRDAALEAAGLTMSDRLSTLDRTTGYGGQFHGQNMDRAGLERDIANNEFDIDSVVRGQNVGERDYQTNEGWRRTGLTQDQQARADNNAWRGTDLALNQQGRADTNAWRGTDVQMQQQGRQDQQAQQAIINAENQRRLEEMLTNSDFDRRYRATELAERAGYGNTPYDEQADAAGREASEAERQRREMAERAFFERLYGPGSAPVTSRTPPYVPEPGRTYDYRNPNNVPGTAGTPYRAPLGPWTQYGNNTPTGGR